MFDAQLSRRETVAAAASVRWSRERCVRFFVDENGSKADEVASEVDRYCSWPGQACGYKIGHSEINRQRAKAQAALGPC